MEKVYGPFNLEEHKYFIRINRDVSSPAIKVFEHYEEKSKIYKCHYKSTPEEIRKLIKFFDEVGGEEFIKNFLADEKNNMSEYDREEYFIQLAPFLLEKWNTHLQEMGVKEEHLPFKICYELGNKHFLSEHGNSYFIPFAKKFISPAHPLIIFEYIEKPLEHIEDQKPRVQDDGTLVIPSPLGTAYAKLRDYGSVEALRKKYKGEGEIWKRTLEEAHRIMSFSDSDLDSFKEYVNNGGLDDYGIDDEPTPPPDTQYEVVFETKDKREYVTIDRSCFPPSVYYIDEDGRLDLSYAAIDDIIEINGLERLTNLQALNLSGNPIKETTGLGRLTNLRELYIKNTKMVDEMGWFGSGYDSYWIRKISGLNHLTNLQKLEITWARIKKISGLNHLTNLRHLDLSYNHIYKIEGLDNLTNLEYLDLSGNYILVVEGLENLKNLTTLKLSIDEENMRYSEMYLAELANKDPQAVVKYCQDKKDGKIPFVTIDGNKFYVVNDLLDLKDPYDSMNITDISEIEGLKNITNLKTLYLSDNQITEIKGLEKLTNLRELWLFGNKITEIKGLEKLTNLRELWLRSNQIEEIKGLEYLTNLKDLDLSVNQVTEIKGLQHLTNLQKLALEYNKITEIKGLQHLTNLQKLNLQHNKITETKGLENLKNLENLDLRYNQFREIKGLECLANLKKLWLNDNQITEIKGLECLTSLETLSLQENPIREDERYLIDKNAQEVVKYCREKARMAKKGD